MYEPTLFFRVFIDFFKEVAIPDKYVHLTVVYFGNEGLSEIQDILSSLEKSLGFTNYKLITFLDKFSRGRGMYLLRQELIQHVLHKMNGENRKPLNDFLVGSHPSCCALNAAFTV